MITGELKSKIDKLWQEFWQGGIANPLTVIEQVTFLMYARLLDMEERKDEKRAQITNKPFNRRFNDDEQHIRWDRFRHQSSEQMLHTIRDEVFPHFKRLAGSSESLLGTYLKDAQLMVQKPNLLVSAVNQVNELPLQDSDTKGDLYEYLLSKLTTAGINGQFRTPRHIIRMMVDMCDPAVENTIADPACGTAGFLQQAHDFLLQKYTSEQGVHYETVINQKGEKEQQAIYSGDLLTDEQRKHLNNSALFGFDFDVTMLRIAAMNLLMHGVEQPGIYYQDTLSQSFSERHPKLATGSFDLILANPPFKGSLDEEDVDGKILSMVKTKKTELLFVAQILRMLKLGGQAAVIVPIGVLEGESSAHNKLRKELLLHNQVEAIISLPHWVFKPYASVATAVLIFTKGGQTNNIWFYKMENDGFSDGASKVSIEGSEIKDVIGLFKNKDKKTYEGIRSKHRLISLDEIKENDFDLCPNIYLRDYKYPDNVPLKRLDELFEITKGNLGAAEALDKGEYEFITSSSVFKKCSQYSFDCKAICIPLVSSTGHGHASINNIHFYDGKFEAASIVAVLILKQGITDESIIEYAYSYLLTHKKDVLVPYMKGSANVSLNTTRLGKIKIPLPSKEDREKISSAILGQQARISCLQSELKNAIEMFDETKKEVRKLI